MKKRKLFAAFLILSLGLSGCGSVTQPDRQSRETEPRQSETAAVSAEQKEKSENIAELYRDVYEDAVKENTLGSLKTVQDIVSRLGENGYAAVDMENQNQIDMENPELIEQFCSQVDEKQNGEATIICVMESGDFIRFDLKTEDGIVDVTRSVLSWKSGMPQTTYTKSYEAYTWVYSEEGYLFFEEYCPPGFDGAPGYTAVRVKPLCSKCRELNRKYILPVGYASNNLFVCNWDETDFGELNFYDLFDRLYSLVYKKQIPYEAAYEGEDYRIPADEFEKVILSCFHIDKEALRERLDYSKQDQVYEYQTRGFYDCANSPNLPFPEVVNYQENRDGTITLTVNAVYPKEKTAKAFSHESVVRPLENGGFQYVSNHIIPSEQNVEPTWYKNRLTEEEREKYYEDAETQ